MIFLIKLLRMVFYDISYKGWIIMEFIKMDSQLHYVVFCLWVC